MDASDFGSDNDGNFSSGTTLGADPSNMADWGFEPTDLGGFGTIGGLGSLANPFDNQNNSEFSLNSLFDNTNSNFSSGSVLGADPSNLADWGFDSPDFGGFGTTGGFGLNDNPISFDLDTNGKNGKKGFNPFNIITTLLTLNPATAPIGMALGLGNGINNAIQSGNPSGLAGTAIGALTGNSTLGNIAGMGINGMSGGNPSGQAGGMAGGMIGNAIAGPIGGMFGSDIGSSLTGGMTSDGPPAGVANGDGPGINFDPSMILGGLGSLYLANQAGNDAKTLANNQTPQSAQGIAGAAGVPTLESMFGPDSAYAQNMRKQLERRDAAKGRRSQYGPREVELQAKLAELASRAAPDYIRATSAAQTAGNTNQQTVNTAQRAADEQRLKILYTLGRESGLFKELGGLFKQQPTQPLPTNYLTNDWMQPAGNTNFGVQNIDPSYQPSSTFYEDL